MALYEITFLTREESDPGVRSAIEEAGGTIQAETSMGRKRLAYPINKETQAVYTTFVFDADTKSIAGIDRRLRLNSNVLRHLIVVKETPKADKEVSKTVREAIAAAEKLEDITEEPKAAPKTETPAVEETPVVEEAPATVAETEAVVETEAVETPAEEEKPAKKTRAKKADVADAASVTEEDRLKALEDKLGEILKD